MPMTDGTNSGEGFMHRRDERPVDDSNPLHGQVTIGILTDDVLLEMFGFYVDGGHVNYWDFHHFDKWHTLIHVCRRWRSLVSISPRHLNVQLLWRPKRSVKKMLDIWPEFPICVYDYGYRLGATDNDVATLKLKDRVSQIRLLNFSPTAWERYAPLMEDLFPILTYLYVQPYSPIRSVISDSFLGGSAPYLQELLLDGVPFPALSKLLLSATNLVRLTLWNIPHSAYISPESMANCISTLTRLESLSLTIDPPRFRKATQIPRPHTPTLHPTLTNLCLGGAPEYVDNLVAHFDAPLLESIVITLFHQEVLDISQLSKFLRCAERLSAIDRATVIFSHDSVRVSITLPPESLVGTRSVDPNTLMIDLACEEPELRLSYLAQVCSLCLPTLSPFKFLKIRVHPRVFPPWQNINENSGPEWLELLCHFTIVKELYLSKKVAFPVAKALGDLPAERVTEVLPSLQTFFLAGLESSGRIMSEFATARQLSGRPVVIRSWKQG